MDPVGRVLFQKTSEKQPKPNVRGQIIRETYHTYFLNLLLKMQKEKVPKHILPNGVFS